MLIIAVAAISKYSRKAAFDGRGRRHLVDGGEHRGEPRVPLGGSDHEREVTHAQPGMALLGAVRGRAAPVLPEEQRERALPGREVVGVERTEHGIVLDALVERGDERVEERLTTDEFEHGDVLHGV